MKKKHILITIIALVVIGAVTGITFIALGSGNAYSYGQPGNVAAVLNDSGTLLYVSYYFDNYIAEVNTSTMELVRTFPITWPTVFELSPDGNYVYAISEGAPSHLVKIRLSDGQTNQLELEGEAKDLAINPDGDTLWVVHRTWPVSGDVFTDPGIDAPPNTGRLSKIDLVNFSLVLTQTIESVPVSIWFSDYTDPPLVYVLHETYRTDYIEHVSQSDPNAAWAEITGTWNPVTIYNSDSLRRQEQELAGGAHNFDFLSAGLANWSDNNRYLAIPSPANGMPAFSIRIVDLDNPESPTDLIFEDHYQNAMGVKYVHKVPGLDIAWCAVNSGFSNPNQGYNKAMVVRVNTATNEHEVFYVNEAENFFGDFAVSPDGNTLYLTVPKAGHVIVWSPD
jgi:DNA-binding beta-propeller fold protein YncE